jgi:hypothetical protein
MDLHTKTKTKNQPTNLQFGKKCLIRRAFSGSTINAGR